VALNTIKSTKPVKLSQMKGQGVLLQMLKYMYMYPEINFTTSVVIGADCIGNYKSNYHTIMTIPDNFTGSYRKSIKEKFINKVR
jgi:hypothetical protein